MNKFRLIFDEIERAKTEDPSLFETFEEVDENISTLIKNMSVINPEDEIIICGTNSTY